jgi:serine protease
MPRQGPAPILMLCLILVAWAGFALAADLAGSRPFAPVQRGFTADAQAAPAYAPNRLLVRFTAQAMARSRLNLPAEKGATAPDGKTGLASVDALAASSGVLAIERPYRAPRDAARAAALGVDRWFLFRFDSRTGAGQDVAQLAATFRSDPNIEAVSVDWVAFPAAVPGDPLYPDHWGHNNTAQLPDVDWGGTYSHTLPTTVGTPGFDANAEAAWDGSQGYGNSGVIIAILDTGVDIDHPDLRLVAGYDFGDNDSNPDDNSSGGGHGTCCAGVAASMANSIGACGIAAGCSIMPCKVANSAGTMYFSSIQSALYWAADHGADIISMSLGAPISSDPATDTALQYAHGAGCVILAATGNENDNAISYPAINQYVIGVGAASPCGERKRSSSSSFECNPGVNTDPNGYTCDGERWWGSNYGVNTPDAAGAVDVIAPTILPTTDIGGNGGYTNGDYEPFFNGTSCATPYAAGICALILSANPTWSNTQVRDQLCSTAQDVVSVESGAGWDRYAGYGMVDAAAAIGGGGPVAPTADFAGSPTSGTYPLAVGFTDLSSGSPTSWDWTFGDGGSSTQQNPSHTYTTAGTFTVSLTAANASGSDTMTKTGYITVNEPGVTAFITASGETSVTGTVSGDFTDTFASDDVRETIREELYTGHPRKQYSYLEHLWSFQLPAGGDVTFHLEASRAANGEGDDYLFEYSTDGAIWNTLATVTSTTDQTYTIGLGTVSGPVTVRVTDTDRSWGNIALDALFVDYMAFEVGDAQPQPPTANFSGEPTSGDAPLTVQFTDASTGDPTSWSWTFGDGATSTARNPQHIYQAPGSYTVSLTASNALGSDAETKNGYITATEPGQSGTTMSVQSMVVDRVKSAPNYMGRCLVTMHDDLGQPVSGATVSADFDGPTGGSTSGVTGADGVATLLAIGIKKPSGEWCFEITGATSPDLTYDPAANVVTRACESGAVYRQSGGVAMPAEFALDQNRPNPFNPRTTISFSLRHEASVHLQVYDVRGRIVATLVDRVLGPGAHAVEWDARQASSGVYFYRLETPEFSQTRRMILLK